MNRLTLSINTISNYLLALCLLAFMAACSETLDDGKTANNVYTLNLELDATEATRNVSTGFPVKDRWCYGDKVTLKNTSTNASYEFLIEVPAGKEAGDIVEERVARFTYSGSIPNATSFTGTVKYVPTESVEQVYPWGDSNGIDPFLVQQSNDNTDHLNCLNELTGSLNNVNLTSSQTILLKRNFGLIKVVLKGFIYPLANGSGIWINGFAPIIGTDYSGLGLVLGKWADHTVETTTVTAGSGKDAKSYPKETLNGTPFFEVSTTKDPLTKYAVDDGRELVAYVPFKTEREVRAKNRLSVTVVDEWSNDIYVWSVKMPAKMEYKVGRCYTLDLTNIEPDIAVEAIWNPKNSTSSWSSRHFGYVRTKNMGAATPADAGNYYIFGRRERIMPGEHYLGYPYETPYYYYNPYKHNNEDLNAVRIRGIDTHTYTHIIFNSTSANQTNPSLNIYKESVGGEYKPLSNLWKSRLLADFEELQYSGIKKVNEDLEDDEKKRDKNEWMLMIHSSTRNQTYPENIFYDIEVVDSNGEVTTDENLASGVRLTMFRTGHSLYFPACGLLEPSGLEIVDKEPMIAHDAVSQPHLFEGKSKYVAILEQYMALMNEDKNNMEVNLIMNIYNMQGEPKRYFAPLYIATPIRPVYDIYGNTPKEMMGKYLKL